MRTVIMSIPSINYMISFECDSMDDAISKRADLIKQNSAYSGVRYEIV